MASIISKQASPDIRQNQDTATLETKVCQVHRLQKNQDLCIFSTEGGSPSTHVLFWCDMTYPSACSFHLSSVHHAVWIMQLTQLCWQHVREYWKNWCLLITFYREAWPTQTPRMKQYVEVNETAQEKRVTVQLYFTGGNTPFAGWFEGSPGPS